MKFNFKIGILASCLLSTFADDSQIIDSEFTKLTHKQSGYKLHSHGVTYGSGSGQQSVTCLNAPDDPNSYWIVETSFNRENTRCDKGQPVKCDQVVRLKHMATKKRLHSHLHQSPLSQAQEVSAYETSNADDNWVVKCKKGKDYWEREQPVHLLHKETRIYLSANTKYQYRNPIPGQLEVSGTASTGAQESWTAEEGIYFGQRKPDTSDARDEL